MRLILLLMISDDYWPNGKLKVAYFKKYDDMVGSFKTWNEVGELTGHTAYDHNGDKIKKLI